MKRKNRRNKKKRKLTRDELAAVIDRAARMQAEREKGEYTREDVLAIARELELDENLLTTVLDEHVADVATYFNSPAERPPEGTRITLEVSPLSFNLTVPRLAMTKGNISLVLLTFAIVTGLFIFVFDFNLVALVLLLGVGVAFVGGTIFPALRWFRLAMYRDTAELKVADFRTSRFLLDTERVQMKKIIEILEQGSSRTEVPLLELKHRDEKHRLMLGYNEAEIDWIISEFWRWSGEGG